MYPIQRWPALALSAFFTIHAAAQTTPGADEKIRELERRIAILEERLNAATPPVAPSPAVASAIEGASVQQKIPASVAADQTGFTIKSDDGNYKLRIGADLQVDNRSFAGEGSAPLPDNILLRRVRPTFSGTVYKYFDFYFRPDFGLGQTVIYDAYLEDNYFSWGRLRVGKFKPPVGLERLQSDDDTSFVERGLPTLLAPSRDIGYQLSGNVLKNRVYYAAGVFNGVPDNSLSDASPSNHRDFAGRVFLSPFSAGGESPYGNLGFGIGASSGSVDGIGLPAYKTVGQNTFLTFASGVASDGHRTRLAPQAYYYLGPFGLLSEYTLAEEGFQKGSLRRDIAFRSWQVQASYILTDESKGFVSPTPRRSFDPRNGAWGAVELALRVGEFASERGLFNYGFADPTKSPRVAREWVGGVNWYLNRLVRISADYGHTAFGGGAVNGNRPAEKVLLLRFQLNFI